MNKLEHVRVAILVTDGFEQVELTGPKKALDDAGAKTSVVSPNDHKVRSWKAKEWDFRTRFIELAGEINSSMPYHVVAAVTSALN